MSYIEALEYVDMRRTMLEDCLRVYHQRGSRSYNYPNIEEFQFRPEFLVGEQIELLISNITDTVLLADISLSHCSEASGFGKFVRDLIPSEQLSRFPAHELIDECCNLLSPDTELKTLLKTCASLIDKISTSPDLWRRISSGSADEAIERIMSKIEELEREENRLSETDVALDGLLNFRASLSYI